MQSSQNCNKGKYADLVETHQRDNDKEAANFGDLSRR